MYEAKPIIFRPLREEETECRVGRVIFTEKFKGVVLLLYKNARADMAILDESVGCANWQREHYEVKGNLYCRVGINVTRDPANPLWVWKSDCGVESNTEAQKGESSDSFKRACVNWGIGRELYTAPDILIKDCNLSDTGRKDKYGKPVYTCYDKFTVRKLVIENGRIVTLIIWNDKLRKFVYEYGTDYNGNL